MTNFKEQLERWAAMLPNPAKPRIARMKAGPDAYWAMRRMFAADTEARHASGVVGDLTGTPVDVLDGPVWPPNLVVAIDQEGNAMSAWILND